MKSATIYLTLPALILFIIGAIHRTLPLKNLRDKVEKLVFRDRFDILLKVMLSGVAQQECTKLYGKSRSI
jgi:hypothetical protein